VPQNPALPLSILAFWIAQGMKSTPVWRRAPLAAKISSSASNYCEAAKRLLTRNNVEYKEIDISTVDGAMDEMIKKANGKRTIPQIFFDDQHIGGYDETRALEKENKLLDLLK